MAPSPERDGDSTEPEDLALKPRAAIKEGTDTNDVDEVPTPGAAPADDNAGDDDEGDEDEEDEEGDEEDEEDEDEEEEDGTQTGPRKRRRRNRRNQFLDIMADVDDEEGEQDDDDEGLEQEDGFIEEEVEEEIAPGSEPVHRRVDNRRDRLTEEDAERLADEYREKYGRSAAAKYRSDSGVVPQRLLLPSVHDPSIFGVNCRIGKEKEAVRALLRKKLSMQYGPNPLEIFSAFQRDSFPGRVYIEARNQKAVLSACKGLINLYANSKLLLVPIKEYPDLFRVRKSKDVELVPGTYVRVKRGKYAGDLAMVMNLSENGMEVQLKLVPRLNYGRAPVIDTGNGVVKRKRATATDRPPQNPFSVSDATKYDVQNLQRRGVNSYIYAGDEYENGFLIKDFKLTLVTTEGVNPTLSEITGLSNSSEEGIDLHAISESLKNDTSARTFQPGELVEVTHGEQTGFRGKVSGMTDDIVSLAGVEAYEGVKITSPAGLLRKFFNIGDHVRVTAGNFKDDTGMVVKQTKDQATLLSDQSGTELTVFSKDLKMASDIGGVNTVGQYTLQDLVQLNAHTVGCIVDIERDSVKVLTQEGQVNTVALRSVVGKLSSGPRSISTDQQGRQIEVGDKVRESRGERREGTIIHIHNQYVFLQNRAITENLGVFVNRVHGVVTVQTKNAERGVDLSRMNPAAVAQSTVGSGQVRSNFNARRILGQKVAIGSGSSYKGLKGTVRNVTDTSAQIELEARNSIITVDVTRLLFRSDGGRLTPFREFISQSSGSLRTEERGGRPRPSGAQTPAWAAAGARTPAAWAAGSGGGGRTPAWSAGAGRTGGRTPAWSGGQTPAWNSGSQTPAWNSGAQTPAWNAGGRTPAWNAGGRTPAWNAGGQTPAWNAGGRTPAWSSNGGGRTPTWEGSRSNGSSFYAAATPGVYGGAPTPGAGPELARTPGDVATPAVWGEDDEDDDDDVPRYE